MIHILQGIDIVPVSKIKRILLTRPELAGEIFTDGEREYCFSRPDPYVHLAGRFAAKEACLKALGTGIVRERNRRRAPRNRSNVRRGPAGPSFQSVAGRKKSDAEERFTSTLYRFHIRVILPSRP